MTALPMTDTVAVIGAGAMGAGIAQVVAQAGHPVLLFDAKEGAAEKGRAGVLAGLDRLVEKGKLTAAERDAVAERLVVAVTLADLKDARLVIEAIVENLDVKRQVFSALEDVVAQDAILATNTSSLSVTAIAAGLKRPERVAGLHFFNPAPVMKLVEIVSGLASSKPVLDTLFDTALAWKKEPVRATSTPGFIVNRVARPFYAEALRLLEEGAADVATIDAVMREAGGFRMGPFELMDLIGHDVNYAVTRSVFDAYFGDPRFRPSLTQQELVAAGWLGRKTGRGFYDYRPDAAKPAPATLEPGTDPDLVVVEGDVGPAEPLVHALKATGVQVTREEGGGHIRIYGATLALTDGRTATSRVRMGEPSDLVLFDLALDYKTASRIAIATPDQGQEGAAAAAAGLFRSLGKAVSVVDDAPGLVVLRTLAMLANEAADAVLQGVASPSDIDRAMTLGVNYPRGPLAWTDDAGLPRILAVLDHLHKTYGDDRYRASRLLRRRVEARRLISTNRDATASET
ncbi:3-hydroxyacyl-CoA dehydrogenase PaaH [Pseudorhizobium flavum]|jgi:3-hydroxybutyryl-CoA dehydrogenase|uniref:3-hydroxybutyryl-CoA dehydrogenase n=1 Tax=Pseudorhizobium flavum TaxID=1335061 RepID=A0A7X0DEG4_9HYPH|nr:3-hydroxyacyl-CoA dehydrogenase PaaH [Pseudorhizobium flavum]EGP53985.1 3-hydroxybutyryl-CoA dehydrogenase [Agrobacterium tumefaciens F2]MBB6181968.1 3-hydroxybutyryl-CoA dehydrogenase [Pseudorhizobium flavum]CAD6631411.1 3-hydroxyacyl-CoA dehydrogenase PaaC [Pseudorhizobium flavum]